MILYFPPLRAGVPTTTPTTPPTAPPHRPASPGHSSDPGTLPPQIDDPDPADIPEIREPEQPHPRLGAGLRRAA